MTLLTENNHKNVFFFFSIFLFKMKVRKSTPAFCNASYNLLYIHFIHTKQSNHSVKATIICIQGKEEKQREGIQLPTHATLPWRTYMVLLETPQDYFTSQTTRQPVSRLVSPVIHSIINKNTIQGNGNGVIFHSQTQRNTHTHIYKDTTFHTHLQLFLLHMKIWSCWILRCSNLRTFPSSLNAKSPS